MKQGTPLVTFHPRGRLGNLMFQTAACIGYAKKHNVPWGLPRNANREVPRFFEFFPGLPLCESNFRNYQEHPDSQPCPTHGVPRDQCWYNYHDIPFHPQGVTLAGFWQSWKYFANAEEEVRAAYRLKEYPEMKDYASIHVRRGDYVQYANSFPPVTVDYIDGALSHMLQNVEQREVMIFSDDIQWCKENIEQFRPGNDVEQSRFEFHYADSDPENPIENLAMMASCSHNIIANSSYSWWAAWLNKNPDKIVVSPSHKRGQWYGLQSGVLTDCVDLIPESWHQIEFR